MASPRSWRVASLVLRFMNTVAFEGRCISPATCTSRTGRVPSITSTSTVTRSPGRSPSRSARIGSGNPVTSTFAHAETRVSTRSTPGSARTVSEALSGARFRETNSSANRKSR